MKFLCLPGAYGSAKNFAVQLGPFAKHMEDRGLATFAFTQGEHEAEPPLGWENYFGSRPLYRFLVAEEGDAFEVVRRVRHIPRGLSPEDTLRLFRPDEKHKDKDGSDYDWSPFRRAIDRVFQTIEDDPEIDGLIGYSEGAMVAACICAEENRRWEESGSPRRIQFAIFFAGTPPLVKDGDRYIAKLADEHGPVIRIPTFHVFGSNDPLVYSSVALFNSCDQDTAQLYDHGLGHLVPRDADNVEQLGDTLSDVITRINSDAAVAAADAEETVTRTETTTVTTTVTETTTTITAEGDLADAAIAAADEIVPISSPDTEPGRPSLSLSEPGSTHGSTAGTSAGSINLDLNDVADVFSKVSSE
ncbi:serine hydrolase-domain-containing protein [Hypoxylon sp. FL1284]|nr:serine hydrolase-domain-containing protein [Hypoxylon sp. FL1284]